MIYRPSYPILNGEEVKADLRCLHCGTSAIHFPHPPGREKKGSGYSKKKPIKKVCICGCKNEFIDRTSNQKKKFFDRSHKAKYENSINNKKKRKRDDEDRMIEKIKREGKRRELRK